jgi:hypothetical protein
MRPEIMQYLDEHPDYRYFMRLHPEWYTRLSRNPQETQQIKEKADDFFGRSLSKKIEKFSQQLGMINMMMELAMASANDPFVKKGETD